MKLSIWLYSHRHGVDVLKVLIPDDVKLSGKDVVRLTQIDWEGDPEFADAQFIDEGYVSREDEFLEHDVDIPVAPEALKQHVVEWQPENVDC